MSDRQALHDAAKAAALAERDRLGNTTYTGCITPHATNYVVGRLVEAALAVVEGRPASDGAPVVVDVASEEA